MGLQTCYPQGVLLPWCYCSSPPSLPYLPDC